MKKTLLALVAFALLSVPAIAAKNENQALAIAKTDPAVRACIANAERSNLDVNAYVSVTKPCDGHDSLYVIDFTASPQCKPNEICPMYIMVMRVATAEVACDNTVTLTYCGGATQ